MIDESTWTRIVTIIAMISLTRCKTLTEQTTSTESSAEYLRKVMLELRDINLPPSLLVTERSTGPFYFDDEHFQVGEQHSSGKRILQQSVKNQNNLDFQASMIQPVNKNIQPLTLDQTVAETATNQDMYYQIPGALVPSVQKLPEVSPFGKADLAGIYNRAIERGNAASLNAFANVLRHRELPKGMTKQPEVGQSQPAYTYHFYPLKTFVNDLQYGNGLLPAVNLRPETTAVAGNSQKDIGNPLFMAISGFIGMAVLFMIGVLFLPRFADFDYRVSDDKKLLDLTKTVENAIDRFNCTNEQTSYGNSNERLRILCQPVKIPKPSSVVLLTRKSALRKEAKKRRKIVTECKVSPCKKNRQEKEPT